MVKIKTVVGIDSYGESLELHETDVGYAVYRAGIGYKVPVYQSLQRALEVFDAEWEKIVTEVAPS